MNVIFTFPGENSTAFKINMDAVPRDKEQVLLQKIDEGDFVNKKDYYTYKANGYEFKNWVVGAVVWSPMRKGESSVNILLQEAP